jgi:hypothetical protein
VFSGVIGGLIGFGIIGLFVGPVVLAVTYTGLTTWIADMDRAKGSDAQDAADGTGMTEGAAVPDGTAAGEGGALKG